MFRSKFFDRLSVRLTSGFLLAAIVGVTLVAVLAYRATANDFSTFLNHVETMERMMGGRMGGMMGTTALEARDFMDSLGRTLWIAAVLGIIAALVLSSFFTRQIVAPLGKVALAARRIARGDLNQRLDIRGSSEITELGASFNRMAETLRHDRNLRQNMVADIAHELRTPLSILQGNVEAMLDGVLPNHTQNLNSLHEETLLLARLIEDLRTLSLAETGALKFRPQDNSFKDLARKVIGEFQTQFAAKNITVAPIFPSDLPPVRADAERTAQVIRNLLSNALQYTPEGGKVSVQLSGGHDGITLSVTDNGSGIPAEDLGHVYERFYRVDRSRSRDTGGSGLGLAIVKQLVEAQGGHVRAESTAGKGSTFSFCLPYAA